MKKLSSAASALLLLLSYQLTAAETFDAAPFALPLPEGPGLLWEDPREIHQVVVEFEGAAPSADSVRIEYWGSRWPQQHLPKDREPGGGDVGWMELGNWYQGGWRAADAVAEANGSLLSFSFRPVDANEFPGVKGYPADFRYTLKLRLTSDAKLPVVRRIQAFTDSVPSEQKIRLAWEKPPETKPSFQVFNGELRKTENPDDRTAVISCGVTKNGDPNTFDRTLVTVRLPKSTFTFAVDDLTKGPLFLPVFGVAVLSATDTRDYSAVASRLASERGKGLYDLVNARPEQTWKQAWEGLPPKKSDIYLPLALDGGRQKFLLEAGGNLRFRANDHFLKGRPGKDTPRFELEAAPVSFQLGPNLRPKARGLEDESSPICRTTWENEGIRLTQTAFVTALAGTDPQGDVPEADTTAVFCAKYEFLNSSSGSKQVSLPLNYHAGEKPGALALESDGVFRVGNHPRGQLIADKPGQCEDGRVTWSQELAPGQKATVITKIPYVLLEGSEQDQLRSLNFDQELTKVAAYWKRRLDQSASMVTPEPVLTQFYRANSGHLLINCEREPGSTRRFARVGSFSYGAYGNESCMMVADLERRGYHREAQECLDAWLHYQGTVSLPGSFAGKEGVLYGAGGYESGGYNQHHGWILWALAEHFRFSRDEPWLRRSADGIIAGADWIIRETARTSDRHELERGLLPAGSLEDIGDWWTWLSTSCYSWRGLDSAAWALEQIKHADAPRIRKAADEYRQALLRNFRAAAQRSPVVRLRDGTAVPHIPSYVHRRGRSFGWICETLEGALHLLITGVLDPHSPEAEWIIRDYEDNLYLSNQYGYTLDDFDKHWFGRGGMSMQACLLLDVEPYLYRDDVKHALRAVFNAIAVSHFPDVHMNTEHALPEMGDWRGDHYKSSDEANACGWLRYVFVREQGDSLLLGQAVPRDWLAPGQRAGIERTATHFGPAGVMYEGGEGIIKAKLTGPTRNPPKSIQLRFRTPGAEPLKFVTVNGKPWDQRSGDWVVLPGDVGTVEVEARY